MQTFIQTARQKGLEIIPDFPLRRITTLRIGGPARYYLKVHRPEQLKAALALARQFDVPFKVLGQASNVLIADKGFNGLIIHNHFNHFEILPEPGDLKPPVIPRYPAAFPQNFSHLQPLLLKVGSGLRLSSLIREMHRQNILGLEWFAGIPATTGGAVYMNVHGGPYFLGDFVRSATLFDGQKTKQVGKAYFGFAYDYSVLQKSKEIVLELILYGWKGEIGAARKFYKWWASQKRLQPQNSAGCIFQNLNPQDQRRLNLPTPSVGYFIDRILGLKGLRKGEAQISPAHAAFIENLGQARARDVLFLIQRVKQDALQKANVQLKLEIELIGFEEDLIKDM